MHPLDILFWSSLALGGVYMSVMLLMGGLSHGAGHHVGGDASHVHVGHDVAHAAHSHAHAHGHADAHVHGDHGHHGHADHGDGAHGDGGFNLFQYLNPTFVSCFLFGFGGLGELCRSLGMPQSSTLVWALAGGFGFYAFAYMFVGKIFGAGTATSHNRRDAIVGLRAQVTAPIEGARPGMVAYTIGGTRQSLRAITDDEEPIPMGATVRIRKVDANTAHVMRIDG